MKKMLLAVVVGGLIFAQGAQAETSHWVTLKATRHVERWQTPQSFGPHQNVYGYVWVKDHRLPVKTFGGCGGDFAGQRLWVRVSTCQPGPMRLSFAALSPMRFRYHYGTKP